MPLQLALNARKNLYTNLYKSKFISKVKKNQSTI